MNTYAKSIIAAVATILTAVASLVSSPGWVQIVIAAAAALGVYRVPNTPRPPTPPAGGTLPSGPATDTSLP